MCPAVTDCLKTLHINTKCAEKWGPRARIKNHCLFTVTVNSFFNRRTAFNELSSKK